MSTSTNHDLAQELVRFAATGFITTAAYDAARAHSVTTNNDRDALDRIMYNNEQDGDTGRVFTLADEIAAAKGE